MDKVRKVFINIFFLLSSLPALGLRDEKIACHRERFSSFLSVLQNFSTNKDLCELFSDKNLLSKMFLKTANNFFLSWIKPLMPNLKTLSQTLTHTKVKRNHGKAFVL